MSTIQELYANRPVTSYPSKHGIDNTLPAPEQLVGIELEIEGWTDILKRSFGGFSFVDDGSLRSNAQGVGIEAITLPVAIKHVPSLLNAFFKHFGMDERNYSERCSTHVHFNVQPLTFEQLTTICLVYQTVERLLFGFVGNDREQSIFCVPWSQSNMSCSTVEKLYKAGTDSSVFRSWQKYSALNLIPVPYKGTIEFRHLHGTCDVKLITTWIAILAKIFEYAQQVDFEKAKHHIVSMNTVSNYYAWMEMVFGSYAGDLRTPNFEEQLSVGVIDSKLMLMKGPEVTDWLQGLRGFEARNPATPQFAATARANTLRDYAAPLGRTPPGPIEPWPEPIDDIEEEELATPAPARPWRGYTNIFTENRATPAEQLRAAEERVRQRDVRNPARNNILGRGR